MKKKDNFEIFLATFPGFEETLWQEVKLKGFRHPVIADGGVLIKGGWSEVWRANLWLRGANRVLARLATFKADNFDQLVARTALVNWKELLPEGAVFRVEATAKSSRLYHTKAIIERVSSVIENAVQGVFSQKSDLIFRVRMEKNYCTISFDSSGELLHKRGYKTAINRAPIRETMAALLLYKCGYSGQSVLYDPMCGSGTFVIEAAEIANRLNPGRNRSFSFEQLLTFDADAWNKMKTVQRQHLSDYTFYGSDRDQTAINISQENAKRADVSGVTEFKRCSFGEIEPPAEHGVLFINPPYGERIGGKENLFTLYSFMGKVIKEKFKGWKVGLITTDKNLAYATGLQFSSIEGPFPHGGLKIYLFRTEDIH
ncbi:THUMP domain-containing class I SAM-dependent RNA methyltransferase [Swingsia samuiensis]|uniref:Class I SAM-dependent RNA methyltransferase n=1 Tax=Swingsia samuiensis TaxID=1293412 RepID=A0A4Y6UJN3_9PROT|nr:THUMP domain-containing protein [Swingsia samuiensis]QDH17772.1 class I SAM-dependent RNA methyltransferase [Swingsia samuiensis]